MGHDWALGASTLCTLPVAALVTVIVKPYASTIGLEEEMNRAVNR
jgi:hypothetical protein